MLVVLGVICLATGILAIVWPDIALLEAIVGAAILAWPDLGLFTLAVFFAVSMLTRGVVSIVIGVKLCSLRREQQPAVQTATYAM